MKKYNVYVAFMLVRTCFLMISWSYDYFRLYFRSVVLRCCLTFYLIFVLIAISGLAKNTIKTVGGCNLEIYVLKNSFQWIKYPNKHDQSHGEFTKCSTHLHVHCMSGKLESGYHGCLSCFLCCS